MRNYLFVFIKAVLMLTLITCTSGTIKTKADQYELDYIQGFVRCDGRRLVDENGCKLYFRGIAFGNNVWMKQTAWPNNHHGEKDYRNIADMGFNAVRFYLNYQLFESDLNPFHYRQSGFSWLDTNIKWARKNNIYLILNMHVPQGGFQSQGRGGALWEDKANQQRFIALWREIARRYAHEPVILGYGILNEPFPTRSIEQWESLARETVKAIRQVDPNHIIIIERTMQIGADFFNDNHNGNLNFAVIDDPNIMYEFHFYKPLAFTHQRAWVPALANIITRYPSADIYEVSGSLLPISVEPIQFAYTEDIKNWKFFKSTAFTIADSKKKVGIPVVNVKNIGQSGTVWCDAITVKEFGPDNDLISTRNCIIDPKSFWLYLLGSGEVTILNTPPMIAAFGGRDNKKAVLKIRGPAQDIYMAGIFEVFPLKQGHTYEVSGWLKGTNLNEKTTFSLSLLCLDTDGPLLKRGKSFIESELTRLNAWAEKMNVPLYLGEFGCIYKAFWENLGALQWVSDVIDISSELGIHYNFHAYHEESFGLYWNSAVKPPNPAEVNFRLKRLFRDKQLK